MTERKTILRTDAAGFIHVMLAELRDRLTPEEWAISKKGIKELTQAEHPDLFDLLPPEVRNA